MLDKVGEEGLSTSFIEEMHNISQLGIESM